MRWIAVAMLSVGLLAGCESDEAEQETPPQTTEPSAAEQESASEEVAAEPQPAPAPPPEALPVPSDFEAEMEKSITEKNYKAELKELESALEADEPE